MEIPAMAPVDSELDGAAHCEAASPDSMFVAVYVQRSQVNWPLMSVASAASVEARQMPTLPEVVAVLSVSEQLLNRITVPSATKAPPVFALFVVKSVWLIVV